MYSYLRTYQEGEKKCQVCGDPLPAITCTKKKRILGCNKKECRVVAFAKKHGMRAVAAGEIKCQGPG